MINYKDVDSYITIMEYIDPESDYGNVEYKYTLINLNDNIIQGRATQLDYRLNEGMGQAFLYIGVMDNGCKLGILKEHMEESLKNLDKILNIIDAEITHKKLEEISSTVDIPYDNIQMFLYNNCKELFNAPYRQLDGMTNYKELKQNRYVVKLSLSRINNAKKETRVVVMGSVDSGKCFQKGTDILLYDRTTKKVEDIRVGDKVIGADGEIANVIETHNGTGQLYTVKQKSGLDYTVNGQHELSLVLIKPQNDYWDDVNCCFVVEYIQNLQHYRVWFDTLMEAGLFLHKKNLEPTYNKHCDIVKISVEEYLKLSPRVKEVLHGYKPKFLDFQEQNVDIDPYFIGLWIINSSLYNMTIRLHDTKIIEYVDNYMTSRSIQYTKTVETDHIVFSIWDTRFIHQLHKYEVVARKHVPHEYIFNSKKTRLAVLAGIVDALGYYENNWHNVAVHSKRIADDINFVLQTLGACINKPERQTSKDAIHVTKIPVLNTVKPKIYSTDAQTTEIEIVKDEIGEYYGFQIDNRSQLFVAPDFTVWHNSSIVGVLTKQVFDDGNGLARASVFNHPHELKSGRTSSIGIRIIGFGPDKKIVNTIRDTSKDIIDKSSKIVCLYDLAGHLQYLRTTVAGVCNSYADFALVIIGANMGITEMTKEHIRLAYLHHIPLGIIFTKIDIAPQEVYQDNMTKIKTLLKGANYQPINIKTVDDVMFFKNSFTPEIVPIISVSNVTGQGHEVLNMLLYEIPKKHDFSDKIKEPFYYTVSETFMVPGIGVVVSGMVLSGNIKTRSSHWLGPYSDNTFKKIFIRSIQYKRVNVDSCQADQSVTFAVRADSKKDEIKREDIKKGMTIVEGSLPEPRGYNKFLATVTIVGRHSTTVRENYEALINCSNVRQTAKIIKIREIKSKLPHPEDDENDKRCLRGGDTATIEMLWKFSPVYAPCGSIFIFRENKIKGHGKILEILE